MRIPHIEPTLNDSQVLEFCHQGYLMLNGVVPDEINRRVTEFIREHPYPSSDGGAFEDDGLLKEDWFVDQVIVNPQAAGAVRSLLGKQAALPTWMYNHQAQGPKPSQHWHKDGCSRYGHEINHLQVFYYPQDTPLELGPTDIIPGSHFLHTNGRLMAHYRNIKGIVPTVAPAGSIFLTVYSVWHRRGASRVAGTRNMLKYLYWRMEPPERDWIIEPDFNLDDLNNLEDTLYKTKPVPSGQDQFRHWHDVAKMFFWLSGKKEAFASFLGTDTWPMGHPPRKMPKDFYTFPGNL